MEQKISKPARERLIRLSHLLEQQAGQGRETVSSAEIQQRTGWTSFTVRRDISMLNASCSSPAGYNISSLLKAIQAALHMDTAEKRCCIVGLGQMGAALAGYSGFAKSAFKLVAGFDSSVNRTETLRTPFPLYTTNRMEHVIKELEIQYAILTVPEQAAQEMALRLSACGIVGIVNYTAAILRLPETTAVENLSVVDSLANLASKRY